jgi:hypothetical protein
MIPPIALLGDHVYKLVRTGHVVVMELPLISGFGIAVLTSPDVSFPRSIIEAHGILGEVPDMWILHSARGTPDQDRPGV